jgi:hypothetical protein
MIIETVFTTGLHTAGAILLGLFTTARVLLWAFLVATAWFEIVEKSFQEEQIRPKKSKTAVATTVELTATTLQQHDAADAVYQIKHPEQSANPRERRWPQHVPPMAGVSEMGDDESIDQWSIWQEGNEPNHTTPEGFIAEPIPPTPPTKRQPATTAGVRNGGGTSRHPGVRPADHDEAQVLSASTMGGNTDLIKEPAKEVVRHDEHGKKHVVKKPLLTRKIEKWFIAPYAQKCELIFQG